MARVTHQALFTKLRDDQLVVAAEQYAHWTLPQLMADLRGRTNRAVVERDYQGMGALLVNHLASKLARVLFPATTPFFSIDVSARLIEQAKNAGIPDVDLAAGLARLELDASRRAFTNASYAQLINALKHLIVTGNTLLYRDTAAGTTVAYGLQSYVTRRDGKGRLLDCVLREFTFVEGLEPAVQEVLKAKERAKYSRPEQQVEVYTRIHRELHDGRPVYVVTQEVDTTPVGEPSVYPEHLCPWQAVTWNLIAGEHHGRGLVEDYAGDFAKLSDMSEAHALYSIEIMRVIHLVSAGSGTDIDDIANAENGEYVRGDGGSVTAHESGDGTKLAQAAAEISEIFGRLAKAFMYQANTRDAERVTAVEIQRDASEAELALGGVYSSLAASVQIPLAHLFLTEVHSDALSALITGDMKLDITAGIPALGRSADVQNMLMAMQEAAAVVPLAQLDPRLDSGKLLDLIFSGRSIDTSKLYKSKEVMEQEALAKQQEQLGQQQVLQAASLQEQADQLQPLLQQ